MLITVKKGFIFYSLLPLKPYDFAQVHPFHIHKSLFAQKYSNYALK